jgi:hypothetical protein
MDFYKMILGREATEEEAKLIEEAQLILDKAELSLLGILPKPRPQK